MSAVAGVLGAAARRRSAVSRVGEMLESMSGRGDDLRKVEVVSGGALGAGRFDWEMARGFAGPVTVVREGHLAVAADASLYYRADLRRRLEAAGSPPRGPTPSHHVLAAYRVWGDACARRLEGDFAFVLWDEHRGRAMAARDFAGLRPLHYARVDDRLVVASTIGGVAAHPGCGDELNLVSIAETAADLWRHNDETCRKGILELPAGHTLTWESGAVPRLQRHWRPPPVREDGGASFDAGRRELGRRLRDATRERLATTGPTTVWMSGGIDSTAVFGAGQQVLRRGDGDAGRLAPVTVRYPAGDPGHEDEFVTAVAGRWDEDVTWLDIDDIPMFDRPARRAARRDSPFAHCYETWIRALARGSRSVGSHVALGGYGGDQLFQVSDVFLADLLFTGRWWELAREWSAKDGGGPGDFYRWVVRPRLPRGMREWVQRIRPGWSADDYLERRIPPWIDAAFVEGHDLRRRERDGMPDRPNGSRAADEMHFYLTCRHYPRISSALAGAALQEGVEVRTPLYDGRVVEFAARRPRRERNTGTERKRLLRASMEGVLPDSVLASRSGKTGLMSAYFDRSTRQESPDLLERTFEEPALARTGLVDGDRLRAAWRRYRKRGGDLLGASLVQTFHAELWLEGRLSAGAAPDEDDDENGRPATAGRASGHEGRDPTGGTPAALVERLFHVREA